MPKEPSSSCSPFGFLVHSIVITIGERIWVLPFSNWLLSITKDFNIMDEKVPEVVVDESDELAHIDIIMDVKR